MSIVLLLQMIGEWDRWEEGGRGRCFINIRVWVER